MLSEDETSPQRLSIVLEPPVLEPPVLEPPNRLCVIAGG